jgi:hypothetical protein
VLNLDCASPSDPVSDAGKENGRITVALAVRIRV